MNLRYRPFLKTLALSFCVSALLLQGCKLGGSDKPEAPRLSLFVGVDVSGSFLKSRYFEDSMDFLSHYLYAHLNGSGGLEKPHVLFVGSLGGMRRDEAKTFYPIQAFEGKSVSEIRDELRKIFPKAKEDAYTDFNSYFEQVETTIKNKGLILRPISIVMISDGVPDFPGKEGTHDISRVRFKPLELLSRNVTVRLLYTGPTVGASWQNKIKRQRVKVWTQDAQVMTMWKDPKIYVPSVPVSQQTKFLNWVKDNVDFPVRMKRVD
jgi:hypothetical protein